MIDPKVKTEQNDDAEGCGRTQATILVHSVIHPVTGAGIPDNAAYVGQEKTLSGTGGEEGGAKSCREAHLVRGASAKKRNQERSKCRPGERIQVGPREDEDLKDAGNDGQNPGASVNSQHKGRITKAPRVERCVEGALPDARQGEAWIRSLGFLLKKLLGTVSCGR